MAKVPLTPEQKAERNRMKALGALFGTQGVNAGNAYLNQFMKPGFLGRVDAGTDPNSALAKDQADIRSRFQSGLEGYTSPEYQAMREQMTRGFNSNAQTALTQLAKAQARGKVYGAAAGAQQANAVTASQNQKDELEQDLYIKNIDERQRRLGEYANLTAGLREEQLGREKVNLGQANAENAAQQSGWLGISGLGLQKSQMKAMQKLYGKGLSAVK